MLLQENKKIFRWYAWLSKNLLFYANEDYFHVFYSGSVPEKNMQELFGIIESRFQKEEYRNCVYYIDESQFNGTKILSLSDKFIDPSVHYNDDIKEFEEKITAHLGPDEASGLILLAGEPGNGQSTYLHYLSRVLRRRFLYLSKWDAPGFDMEHLDYMDHARPLLILEDADEYDKNKRTYKGSLGQFVKDLLHGNISKKIKADAGHHNPRPSLSHYPKLAQCDSPYIVARYEFKPLAEEKARSLALSLGKSIEIKGPLSLHQIFHS